MNPLLTIGYMTEQITRDQLDRRAARGWLAVEAAGQHIQPASTKTAQIARLVRSLATRMGVGGGTGTGARHSPAWHAVAAIRPPRVAPTSRTDNRA